MNHKNLFILVWVDLNELVTAEIGQLINTNLDSLILFSVY